MAQNGGRVTRNLSKLPRMQRPGAPRTEPDAARVSARDTSRREEQEALERLKAAGGKDLDAVAAAIKARRAGINAARDEARRSRGART